MTLIHPIGAILILWGGWLVLIGVRSWWVLEMVAAGGACLLIAGKAPAYPLIHAPRRSLGGIGYVCVIRCLMSATPMMTASRTVAPIKFCFR